MPNGLCQSFDFAQDIWYISQVKVIPHYQQFLILIFISLLIFAADNFRLLSLPKQLGYFITNPISRGLYLSGQGFRKQLSFIFAARLSAQENKAKEEQLGQLLSENADLRRKLAETQAILLQQQSIDPKTYNLIPARPIGLDRYLRIDKGLKDGIKLNQAVIFKDTLLGRVVGVTEQGAGVMLLRDPDSKINAFSLNKAGKAKGILVGNFGSEMLLDKILHEEQIVDGDLVYSAGVESSLPRGLILGRVSQVLNRENEVFKQAKVKPVFDIGDLELVFVIQ